MTDSRRRGPRGLAAGRLLAAIVGVVLTLGLTSGCSQMKGVGDSTGNKIQQGGDAGGSTGYP